MFESVTFNAPFGLFQLVFFPSSRNIFILLAFSMSTFHAYSHTLTRIHQTAALCDGFRFKVNEIHYLCQLEKQLLRQYFTTATLSKPAKLHTDEAKEEKRNKIIEHQKIDKEEEEEEKTTASSICSWHAVLHLWKIIRISYVCLYLCVCVEFIESIDS